MEFIYFQSKLDKLPVLTIEDLSRFGTLVNNAKIPGKSEVVLKDGDVLKFGTMNSTYRCANYAN